MANEEKNIGSPELTDVLATLCRRLIIKHSDKSFSSPNLRGRPISQFGSNNETRGRKSYYEVSRVKQIIDQVLNDHETFIKIDGAVTSSNIYFKYIKYSIEVFLQMQRNRKEFLKTYRPIFKKYGFTESNIAQIDKENISDDQIEKIAVGLALDTKPTKELGRAIYIQGGIIYFDHIMQKHSSIT